MTTEPIRLGDVLELVRDPMDINLTEPYQKIGVRSFGKGIFHYEPMPGSELGKLRFYAVRPGELVLSNIKAWEGAIAISGEEDAGLVASNRFLTYQPRLPARVDVRFLRYLLLSDTGMAHIQGASPGSADRNRTLGIKAFEDIELPLPTIGEQQNLADQLEAAEARTSRVQDHLQTAKELSSKALNALVHRADLDDDERRAHGWRRVPMSEVVDHVDRRELLADDQVYPIAGMYSFGKGLIDRDPIRGRDTSYKRMTALRLGDLVMSKLNGWEGALAVVEEPFDGYYVSSEYPVFEVHTERITPSFLAALVSTSTFWQALDNATRGSMVRRRRVHPSGLLATAIWLPPLDYQELVGEHLDVVRQVRGEERRAELLEAVMPSVLNSTFG